VARGANAEFGRTGGGVVNVITSRAPMPFMQPFLLPATRRLDRSPPDGSSVTNFLASSSAAVRADPSSSKLFYFGPRGHLRKPPAPHLSAYNAKIWVQPRALLPIVFRSNITDAQIDANGDCQRQVLLNFTSPTLMRTTACR